MSELLAADLRDVQDWIKKLKALGRVLHSASRSKRMNRHTIDGAGNNADEVAALLEALLDRRSVPNPRP